MIITRQTICKIASVALAFFMLAGCDSKVEVAEDKQLRPVRSITVSQPDLKRFYEFSAVVDASKKADLSFKISGEIIEFYFDQGEDVKAGQLIAKLDDKDVKIQLNEAKSSFEKASADFSRARNLIQSKTISQSDFDQLKAQYESSKAKLEAAQNSLAYTELKASFDGVVAKRYSEKYQEITAKAPIVSLHDLDNIDLKISVPETIMIRVRKNVEPPKMSAKFAGIKDQVFPVTFKEVSTQADEISKTYEVTLTMKAPQGFTILPGMTADVKVERLFPANEFAASFYLPPKTVQKDTNSHYVYIVESQSSGVGVIKKREVQVGDITQLGIEIFSGINIGDRVLTAGMSKVTDGMKVKDGMQVKDDLQSQSSTQPNEQ